MRHPVTGELELAWQALQVLTATDQTLVTCTAPVGSPTREALRILASWTPAEPCAARRPWIPGDDRESRITTTQSR